MNNTASGRDKHADFLSFLSLLHSRVLRPFERMFHEKLTNLQVITLCMLRQNGATSITELAEKLCLSKQQMAKLVGQLNINGFVRRSHPSNDHRVVLVELAEDTSDMLSDFRERYFGSLISRISESEGSETAERFLSAADEICDILSRLPAARNDCAAESE